MTLYAIFKPSTSIKVIGAEMDDDALNWPVRLFCGAPSPAIAPVERQAAMGHSSSLCIALLPRCESSRTYDKELLSDLGRACEILSLIAARPCGRFADALGFRELRDPSHNTQYVLSNRLIYMIKKRFNLITCLPVSVQPSPLPQPLLESIGGADMTACPTSSQCLEQPNLSLHERGVGGGDGAICCNQGLFSRQQVE